MIASTPGCARCKQVARALDKCGIDFDLVDVTKPENAELARRVRDLGYKAAPVVLVPERLSMGREIPEHWSGVRPDYITELAKVKDLESDPFERDRNQFPHHAAATASAVETQQLAAGRRRLTS